MSTKSSSVSKHRIGYSSLSGEIFLYRHGKDPGLALDKREALQEVMLAASQHLLHDMPEGASAVIDIDGRKYVIAIVPEDSEKAKDLRP
jgi:hypothetical protein